MKKYKITRLNNIIFRLNKCIKERPKDWGGEEGYIKVFDLRISLLSPNERKRFTKVFLMPFPSHTQGDRAVRQRAKDNLIEEVVFFLKKEILNKKTILVNGKRKRIILNTIGLKT